MFEIEPDPEVGHANSTDDLSTPVDDDQVEPGAQPWTADDDDRAAAQTGDDDAES